ncbi:ABC transporter permease [Actinomadura barringtoniae]|uniref:ABC transporter permease n=1 Tax=Actinomadura barringtoniae TaxID=1427535 RepID=A0A939T699_9ACTN|nr:ABC transporter permease [Actinomadura barringtoniae]MBO2448027.1 ABC transporter permease [Actinomadura barringtoniae]
MRLALHAEWTKLRTVAAPAWLLLGTIVATVALSAAAASVVTNTDDPTRLSLIGVELGQALVAVLAVLVISGEFGSGMIQTTLTAMPRRMNVLAAKAITLTAAVTAAGTVAVLGAFIAGRLILPAPPITHEPTPRAVAGSVLYLILIALLSLGVATAVRDSATSIGVVLGLLYLVPIIARTIGDPHWQRLLQQVAPMSAGLAVQVTTDLHDQPIGPWAGLGVLAAWTATALLTGWLRLRR